MVERIGWVQIDTLQMVQAASTWPSGAGWAHTIPRFSTGWHSAMAASTTTTDSHNERRLFEYWMHAACVIPLTLYRNVLPTMLRRAMPQASAAANGSKMPQQSTVDTPCAQHVRANGTAR